ncbi:hypothetical protein F4779DRAFT_5405 [Xylariaceae sp. FL0662B]|nr:hypothetical protein F4779DRAFT_5405 [Xylariaceae sp. FL0662B]
MTKSQAKKQRLALEKLMKAAKEANSKPEAKSEQVRTQVKQGIPLGMTWSTYAKSSDMLAFGGWADSKGENQNQNPPVWSQSTTNDEDGRSQPTDQVRRPKQRQPLQSLGQFGRPSPQDHRFKNLVWTRKSNPVTTPERTLENLYRDYPEKQLKSIKQSTLDLTADAALQVTNEAVVQWLDKWCPHMTWSDIFGHIRPDATTDEAIRTNQFVVPEEALNLKGSETKVADVFRKCHAIVAGSRPMKLTDLVEMIDHCILLCDILRDEKRQPLLGKVKEMVHWLPIGLDCKKLEIQQKACRHLRDLNAICSAAKRDGKRGRYLKKADQERFRKERENEILERALVDFEEHKVAFRVELLKQLKQLLESTKMVDSHEAAVT